MKKIGLLLGSVLLAASLVGCGEKKAETAAAPAPEAEKLPIGLTAYRFDDNFIALFRKAFQVEADAAADKFNLTMIDSQNSVATEKEQIEAVLEKGVKSFAINLVDASAADGIINLLKEKAVPVVFYNRKPSDEAMASYDNAFYVGIDPNAQGIAQGELIEKLWKENPAHDLNGDGVIQYVMFEGEPGHPDAVARTKYSISTLNDKGIKTEMLHQDTAMWDTAMAKDKMDAWLSGPNGAKIEIVICNNDGMALGAIESMKATGKLLPVVGVDALPEALVKIEEGEMAGTVLNDAKGQASATFKMVANLAEGKAPTEGTDLQLDNKIILVPSIGIDKTNVASFK
ncbi:galactose/glucose ABC transporter substrate-binding protein MglB [Fusobacterium gastrosuis]|uniref:galactose/glucose ABC transporter substrate-binding protein MglB n=1 Tax=Fusobacterium gastrosuis TaxID=1755100 RepID=UPI002A9EC962|nr:galactose/glucose ABC transporter substrate-binding protein MglB [Fusobacterium gastrosuis]